MYAVIKTGGKQYRVAAGEKIKIEQIAADVGQEITHRSGAGCRQRQRLADRRPPGVRRHGRGEGVSHGKHDKVRIFKMRRRKHYQKRQGHRQGYTELEIGAINGVGASKE
jgi:large subunit ribosomal protein L21